MTFQFLSLLAALGQDPTLGQLIEFVVVGLVVVLLALSCLAVSCSVVGYLLNSMPWQKGTQKEAPAADDELSEEMLVVLVAAVAAVVSEPHKIIHVRGLTPEDMAWALEGRIQHHSSHTIQLHDHQ